MVRFKYIIQSIAQNKQNKIRNIQNLTIYCRFFFDDRLNFEISHPRTTVNTVVMYFLNDSSCSLLAYNNNRMTNIDLGSKKNPKRILAINIFVIHSTLFSPIVLLDTFVIFEVVFSG